MQKEPGGMDAANGVHQSMYIRHPWKQNSAANGVHQGMEAEQLKVH